MVYCQIIFIVKKIMSDKAILEIQLRTSVTLFEATIVKYAWMPALPSIVFIAIFIGFFS